MSLNLSRNAVAMERALSFLADAERSIDDCASCLARDVIVSEAQAAEHNRSIVCARNALHALRGQIQGEHGEVCRHLRDAQMVLYYNPNRSLRMATGYTESESNVGRESLTFLVLPMNRMRVLLNAMDCVTRQRTGLYGNSTAQCRFVISSTADGCSVECWEFMMMIAEVWRSASSQDSAVHDDECETVKGLSDDGHSYAGTVVRGVLRGDSE